MSDTTKTTGKYIVTITMMERGAGLAAVEDINSTVVGTIAEAKTRILDYVKRLDDYDTVIEEVETKLATLGVPVDDILVDQRTSLGDPLEAVFIRHDYYQVIVNWTVTTLA